MWCKKHQQHYPKYLKKAIEQGLVTGKLQRLTVTHEAGCAFLDGFECDCDPYIDTAPADPKDVVKRTDALGNEIRIN